MFIAHLPAGYLWTRYLLRRRFATDVRSSLYRKLMALGLAGEPALPDVDMLYFYLIDNRQHLHHGYWTHIPLYWLALFIMSLLAGEYSTSLRLGRLRQFFSNVLIHLVLDTVVGKVRWFAPFSGHDFMLFEVPARHGWWVWNFMFHWTILLELALVIAAVVTFLISRRTLVAAKS